MCVVMLQIATAPECKLQKFKLGDEFETVETVGGVTDANLLHCHCIVD